MDEISISKFKATCLAVLEKVRTTGEPIRVTKFGKAIAEIWMPSSHSEVPKRVLERPMGFLEGAFEITGDIVNTSELWPIDSTLVDWDRQDASVQGSAKRTAPAKTEKRSRPARKSRS